MENGALFRAAGARTGLPKNRACLLILLPLARRGISGEVGNRMTLHKRAAIRFNKKKHKTAG
jgi:hypothetical protein